MLIFKKYGCTIESKVGDSMKLLKVESLITTFIIALVIQLFAKEITHLAVFIKGNIMDCLMLSGIITIIVLLMIRNK